MTEEEEEEEEEERSNQFNMVPTTTTEGKGTTDTTGTTDAANGTATGANTGATTTTAAATIPQASNNTPHGSTPHGTAHGSNTPHGKVSNGSTTLVMPGARPQYIRRDGIDTSTDADNEEVNTTPGFMSSTALLYKQKWGQAQMTIAHTRALLKKYGAHQDFDPDFIAQAFELNTDPGNNSNNTTGNFQNTTTTANGTGTGHSLTTTAINGS